MEEKPAQEVSLPSSPTTVQPETQNPASNPKKAKWSWAILAIVLLLVAAIGGYFLTIRRSSGEPTEIVIGYNADQTTPGTGPAGISALHGLQIAVDEINAKGGLLGKKIRIVALDDKGNKDISKNNMQQLIFQDKVLAVIGPANSANALYWLDIPQENGITVISPIASAGEITSRYQSRQKNYIFRTTWLSTDMMRNIIAWMIKKTDNGNIAIINDSTAYGTQGIKDVTDVLARWGKIPVFAKSFDLNASAESLISIIQSAKEAGADGLIFYTYSNEDIKLLEALGKVKNYNPVIAGTGAAGNASMSSKLIFPLPSVVGLNDRTKELDKKLVAKYGNSSSLVFETASQGYDTMQLLAAAIKNAGTLDKAAVRNALESVQNVQGVIKLYDRPFNQENHGSLTINDIFFVNWVNGQKVKYTDDATLNLEVR